jgi:hypothetical protein
MAAQPAFVEARQESVHEATPPAAAAMDDLDVGFDSPFDDELDVPAFLRKKKAASGPLEG